MAMNPKHNQGIIIEFPPGNTMYPANDVAVATNQAVAIYNS
jgi:hypothetical protein